MKNKAISTTAHRAESGFTLIELRKGFSIFESRFSIGRYCARAMRHQWFDYSFRAKRHACQIENPKSKIHHAPRGFTLIELLTVIAIIGVLAGILIPVVGRVRLSARAATISSNLRQIHAGIMLWAGDNKDRYMPAMGAAVDSNKYDWSWYGRKYGTDSERYETPLGTYLNTPVKDWRAINQITISPLNRTDTSIIKTSAYGYPYRVNYWVMSHGTNLGVGAPTKPVPISSLIAPSRIIMMFDSIADDAKWGMGSGSLGTMSDRMDAPFGGKGHVLWADGHVTLARPDALTEEMLKP